MTDELRREVVVARRRERRFWFAVLAGIAVPAQAITMMYVLRPREHVRVVHTASADIVAMPIPLPIEHTVTVPLERTTCPPPRTDARFVAPARLPEAITWVRPSDTNAGWIAAWNAQHVFISTDGGASWHRRLDAASAVQDVTFDSARPGSADTSSATGKAAMSTAASSRTARCSRCSRSPTA